jgi:hypothetical protein
MGSNPYRTVTPRTVTPAPGTVTTHNRVLSCAARVGEGTFVRSTIGRSGSLREPDRPIVPAADRALPTSRAGGR